MPWAARRQARALTAVERTQHALEAALRDLRVAVAERRALTADLREQAVLHHTVLDGVPLGIITTTATGAITFANRAARELLGLESASGGAVRDWLGIDASPEELAGGPDRSYCIRTPSGGELEVALTVSPVDGDGTGTFFVLVRDVSDEKRRTAERERFERLAAIGTMVAGFAHEVRNPVASLRSLAESLAEDLADAKWALPQVSRMLQVLERIERLVRTSLQFGRPATPRRALHRPWTILAAALGEIGPRTRELGGEVRVEVEPDLPDVLVDDGQLIQVLVILFNNALDAAGTTRKVSSRVASSRAGVRFEVRDEGTGIPPEILGRIFDPFFTTKSSGTGLGLSIAQHIVSENGASIEVSSTRGTPTTFTVLVPTAARRDGPGR